MRPRIPIASARQNRLGERREIGHVHGEYLADIPFPTQVRDEAVAAGRAAPHHIQAECGWASFYVREPAYVQHAIDLLRLSYDLALKQKSRAPDTAP